MAAQGGGAGGGMAAAGGAGRGAGLGRSRGCEAAGGEADEPSHPRTFPTPGRLVAHPVLVSHVLVLHVLRAQLHQPYAPGADVISLLLHLLPFVIDPPGASDARPGPECCPGRVIPG